MANNDVDAYILGYMRGMGVAVANIVAQYDTALKECREKYPHLFEQPAVEEVEVEEEPEKLSEVDGDALTERMLAILQEEAEGEPEPERKPKAKRKRGRPRKKKAPEPVEQAPEPNHEILKNDPNLKIIMGV